MSDAGPEVGGKTTSLFGMNSYENVKEFLANEGRKERIIRMYSLDRYGALSPELQYVLQNSCGAAALFAFIGGLSCMKKTKEDFLRRNVASTYESAHLARRNLTDTMSLSAIKGAVKYAFRYGSFTSLYLLTTMTVANYNNKITVWEHAAAGALIGSIVRMNYGLKGISAAATLGGAVGLLAGGLIWTSLKLTGTSLEDLRLMQHQNYNRDLISDKKQISSK